MEPLRQHLRARVAVGTGSPSFAANGVSPRSGHIFLGLSFLSRKIKDLQDLSSLKVHDSIQEEVVHCLLLLNPHDAATAPATPK